MGKPFFIIGIFLFYVLLSLLPSCRFVDKVSYAVDVKPILNKHCLSCHGGVQKKGGFSLLFKNEAFAKGESGKFPIIPGDANNSELIKRLHHSDPEERMPYQKDPLSKKEIQILTDWINQGAEWTDHWAYVPVKLPKIPDVDNAWVKHDLDRFIIKTAQDAGLQPMKKASDSILSRRLALDIIGLPLEKSNDINIETFIDTLLGSPKYGEKWTSMWLDLARYADTKGYERDDNREIWRYRDWLINAINDDLPYDEFIVKQLAGDLQENPEEADYIATAYHRNTMTNDEGGTDNEEFRTAAVMDRVNTTWEAFMGTTFACVQCHSHPYDEFKHEDYYRFMAFFNNTRDEDTFHDYPIIRHLNDSLHQRLSTLETYLDEVDVSRKQDIVHFIKTLQPSVNSIQAVNFVNAELNDTKFLAMRKNSQATLLDIDLSGKNTLILQARAKVKKGTLTIRLNDANGRILSIQTFITPENEFWKWKNYTFPIDSSDGKHNLHLSFDSPELKDLNTEGLFFNWFHFTKEFPGKNHQNYAENKQLFQDLVNVNTPSTPIMLDNPPHMFRPTYIFERGSWLSKGNKVTASIPEIFKKSNQTYADNRLGLAQWMVSNENPLVARTIVNRIWEQLFGVGLVETLEDLGSQALPSPHIPLLDYLSYQLMNEYQWSIKRLIKEIVSSATYQQESYVTNEHLALDQFNNLFARGPRVRLTGEQLRDQALYIAGVLSDKMYGPPVMPYQPEGIWSAPYSGRTWVMSEGEDKYRRAVYTFWKRTSPYPSMITFDGAGREICEARRIRTNTPLQALVTMNDSVYIDLSNQFAILTLTKSKDLKEQIKFAYQRATGKAIKEEQLKILSQLYTNTKAKYAKNNQLLKNVPMHKELDSINISAMAMVCNAILNLDEVIVKS
jgi:hypothetical protein